MSEAMTCVYLHMKKVHFNKMLSKRWKRKEGDGSRGGKDLCKIKAGGKKVSKREKTFASP